MVTEENGAKWPQKNLEQNCYRYWINTVTEELGAETLQNKLEHNDTRIS
jgi:hypothetical protein